VNWHKGRSYNEYTRGRERPKMKGIYLNGVPWDPEYVVDVEIKESSFTFHYIYKPIKERKVIKSHPRCSRVRKIEVKDATS
jgi:hypothetical protein